MTLQKLTRKALVVVMLVGALAVFAPSTSPASAHGANQNGCTLSPDSGYAPVYFNFHNSCDWHDLCYFNKPYGSGSAGRKACDDGFRTRMRTWCADRYPGTLKAPLRWDCYAVAETYYGAVRTFGGAFF